MKDALDRLRNLASEEYAISPQNVRIVISDITRVFVQSLLAAGYDPRQITRVTTKFRDAGRRSPPWQPASKKVPGRPQDGADGNRRLRWLFPRDHKFYANEIDATLSEVKYYLQALSMTGAPDLPPNSIQDCFTWLAGHRVAPGEYFNPIQLIPIHLPEVVKNTRATKSGHLIPLIVGGATNRTTPF